MRSQKGASAAGRTISREKYVRGGLGCVARVTLVTTPKVPPPPPRRAQKRSSF
ncbi:hypothetical protein IMZ48_38735 [Candidatus Bathyarchaeota archaeon]|nr:hypothetical protein [Candidatus Bathyarchaeota archaeon]